VTHTVRLPEGWTETTLGTMFKWGSGGTPRKGTPSYYDGDVPWAIIGDLSDGPIGKTTSTITELGLEDSSAKWVEPDSVLVAMYGSIGKLGVSTIRLATNQAIAFTQPDPIPAKYLFYYLMRERHSLIGQGKGGTQSNISQTVLKAYPFIMAPLNEQHRIVEAIESHLTRLDAAVASLKRVQQNLKRYRASVLNAAVEGRLVPTEAELARKEGRSYEPASELLKRILAERKTRWIEDAAEKTRAKAEEKAREVGKAWSPEDNDKTLDKARKTAEAKYKEPEAPNLSALQTQAGTTDLPDLPEGWCWTTVEQLLREPLTNGRSVPTADEGFDVLRLTSLVEGRIDVEERKTGNWTAVEAAPFLVERADIFVARGNGSIRLVGVAGLVLETPPPVAFPDTMIRLRLVDGSVLPRLFVALWNSRVLRGFLEAKAKTTAGIYKVNQKDIATMPVPLAPAGEQARLLRAIDLQTSMADASGVSTGTARRRTNTLRQAILKWAFEGKLVEQDPNDEPASVLLERIKAERESMQPRKRRRTSRRKKNEPAEHDEQLDLLKGNTT